jgi:hypothetical protein
MPRVRALLALLLAVTWCSAAWHVDLEAVGLMLQHEHHAHADHDTDHGPVGTHDDHEEVFARDVTKDQLRVGAVGGLWIAVLTLTAWLVASARPSVLTLKGTRRRRETDPPLAHVWQFLERCAPESAAPPALG